MLEYIPVILIFLVMLAMYFIIGLRKDLRNLMQYQNQLTELIKLKSHILKPDEEQKTEDKDNIKKAIIRLLEKL